MQPHILLIGIKSELATYLTATLSQQGYRVSQIDNSVPNPLRVQQIRPDLIIMHLPSAGDPDLVPCRHLSLRMRKTPIMLLGSGDIQDRIAGLNVCANDYLLVPFAIEELLARVRAKLRRVSWEKPEEVFTFADLRLDARTHEVYRDDQLIELTAKEFDLLKYLMAHPRQVLTHQQILDAVWPDALLANDLNILHVYIRYLRRKLGPANRFIQTVRGMGYVLKDNAVPSNVLAG